AVAVAAMATILASTLSPEIQAMQDKLQGSAPQAGATHEPYGLCETPGVPPEENIPPAAKSLPPAAQQKTLEVTQQACAESIAGFQKAYRVTFYASIVALIVGAFLPGWPRKWAGRAAMQGAPMPAGGH